MPIGKAAELEESTGPALPQHLPGFMTPTSTSRILLVEDNQPLAHTYEEYLKGAGYDVTIAGTGAAAQQALRVGGFVAAVLDVELPDMTGIDILRFIRNESLKLPAVVITAHGSINVAVEAMREGAFDFIVKPFPAARLRVTLQNALQHQELTQEVQQLRGALLPGCYYDFIGESPVMQAVYRTIDAVAASKASVFITGESGTGKELAAQALHKASPRRGGAFVPLNCGAIPENLLESQIFGHVKGAFTGAVADHAGAGKAADGGTLFLDEVGELPLELQVKLLRFLQTGEVQAVGSSKVVKVDTRIVAATNRDPLAEVKAGRFREDLYYRLHVVPLEMPPLREREDDVLLLARHFLQKFTTEDAKHFIALAPATVALFRRYSWPGNVRQLENLMRSTVVLHDGETVLPEMLPETLRAEMERAEGVTHGETPVSGPFVATLPVDVPVFPLWQVEKTAILAALVATGQDVPRAAALLEVSPSTLYRKLQSWKNASTSA